MVYFLLSGSDSSSEDLVAQHDRQAVPTSSRESTTSAGAADPNAADDTPVETDSAGPTPTPAKETAADAASDANASAENAVPDEDGDAETPPRDPFQDLDARNVDSNRLVILELPRAPRGLRSQNRGATEVAQLFVENPNECEMELIGSDVVFSEDTPVRIEHTHTGTWELIAETQTRTRLATFTLQGDALSFQWEASRDRLEPDRLRWCLLDIRIGDQSRRCRLRSAVEPDPPSFLPEEKVEIPLVDDDELLPLVENLLFELKPQGLPPHDVRHPRSALPALHFMVSVNPRRAAHFALQWEFVPNDPPAKLVVTSVVAYHPLIENRPDTRQSLLKRSTRNNRVTLWSRTKHDAWVERLTTLQDKYRKWRTDVPYPELQDAIDWIGNLTEQRARHPDTPKYQQLVDQWNKKLTAALAEIKTNMDQLTTLDPIITKIGEDGQWHYRIYVTIDGQQVDVVRTRGFPES